MASGSPTPPSFSTGRAEIALYRKIHMFDVTTPDGASYRESAVFKPGEQSRPMRARA